VKQVGHVKRALVRLGDVSSCGSAGPPVDHFPPAHVVGTPCWFSSLVELRQPVQQEEVPYTDSQVCVQSSLVPTRWVTAPPEAEGGRGTGRRSGLAGP